MTLLSLHLGLLGAALNFHRQTVSNHFTLEEAQVGYATVVVAPPTGVTNWSVLAGGWDWVPDDPTPNAIVSPYINKTFPVNETWVVQVYPQQAGTLTVYGLFVEN